jgi:hypothetical protein
MGFLKKNLLFSIVVVFCLLVFAAGTYLALAQAGSIDQAKREIVNAKSQLDNLSNSTAAPTEANIERSQQNVAELKSVLSNIRDDLQRGSRLTTSSDGIGVMAGIQQYISDYQRKAEAHTNEVGEPDPIELPADFAFGFEQYIDRSTPLEDPALSAVLDKQRQILSYLMEKLLEADPSSIVSVKREVLEVSSADQKGFKISPAVSARVPGAIDTLAFSISFNAYTESLREFLNSLAKFDLPIVVRSIKVDRPSQSQTTAAPRGTNNLDSIFGAFGGSETETAPEEAQKPVISENISTFTVVVEFIEIVLPDGTTEAKG